MEGIGAASSYRCPACGDRPRSDAPVCAGCGADLTRWEVREIYRLDVQAHESALRRADLVDSLRRTAPAPAQPHPGPRPPDAPHRTPLLGPPAPASKAPPTRWVPPAEGGPVPATARPVRARRPGTVAAVAQWPLQQLLLAVGGALLAIATLGITAARWSTLPDGAKVVLLAGAAGALCAAARHLRSRDLPGTAEAFDAVALVIVAATTASTASELVATGTDLVPAVTAGTTALAATAAHIMNARRPAAPRTVGADPCRSVAAETAAWVLAMVVAPLVASATSTSLVTAVVAAFAAGALIAAPTRPASHLARVAATTTASLLTSLGMAGVLGALVDPDASTGALVFAGASAGGVAVLLIAAGHAHRGRTVVGVVATDILSGSASLTVIAALSAVLGPRTSVPSTWAAVAVAAATMIVLSTLLRGQARAHATGIRAVAVGTLALAALTSWPALASSALATSPGQERASLAVGQWVLLALTVAGGAVVSRRLDSWARAGAVVCGVGAVTGLAAALAQALVDSTAIAALLASTAAVAWVAATGCRSRDAVTSGAYAIAAAATLNAASWTFVAPNAPAWVGGVAVLAGLGGWACALTQHVEKPVAPVGAAFLVPGGVWLAVFAHAGFVNGAIAALVAVVALSFAVASRNAAVLPGRERTVPFVEVALVAVGSVAWLITFSATTTPSGPPASLSAPWMAASLLITAAGCAHALRPGRADTVGLAYLGAVVVTVGTASSFAAMFDDAAGFVPTMTAAQWASLVAVACAAVTTSLRHPGRRRAAAAVLGVLGTAVLAGVLGTGQLSYAAAAGVCTLAGAAAWIAAPAAQRRGPVVTLTLWAFACSAVAAGFVWAGPEPAQFAAAAGVPAVAAVAAWLLAAQPSLASDQSSAAAARRLSMLAATVVGPLGAGLAISALHGSPAGAVAAAAISLMLSGSLWAPERLRQRFALGDGQLSEQVTALIAGTVFMAALDSRGATLAVTAMIAVAAFAHATRPGRAQLTALGGAATALVWLLSLDTVVPGGAGSVPYEAVSLPLALCTLPWARWAWRQGASSWVAFGPGLVIAAVGSLTADPHALRLVGIAMAGSLVAAAGVKLRAAAPIVLGTGAAGWVGVDAAAGLVTQMPAWAGFAAAGSLLVFLGSTFEARRRDVAAGARYAATLR